MSIFNRDMAIEQLRKGHGRGGGVLEIPEGFTELSEDFALLFDWMPEENCFFPFREIRIPSTVQTINGITLTGYGPDETPVKRFKKISVAKDNPYYMDVDGVLFSKDLKRLICYPCGKPEHTYVVPETVEIIDEYAFQKNVNLRKVMLPSSLRRIENGTFFHCAKLAIINLPESLEYIGEGCFELSFKIDRLVIPKNIKSIKTSFFAYASIIFIPNNSIELEYDSITTNYIDMFTGPAILSDGNEEIVDFAETYDYPHFENCFEDENGIIWADHGRVLISFPSDWKSEEYELPEEVEEVYLDAFKSSAVKRFYSKHNVSIVGEKIEDMYDIYGNDISIKGEHFHVFDGLISCDDKKVANQNLQERFADSTNDKKDNYVFISYKNTVNGISTMDSQMAKALYMHLKNAGITTFFAGISLATLGADRYKEMIDEILDESVILIVVGTSLENIQSSWVKYEWDSFYNDILIGKKIGRMFSYVDQINPHDLPRTLRNLQCFEKEHSSLEEILKYVKNALYSINEEKNKCVKTTKTIKESISASDESQNEEGEKESTNMTKSVFVNKLREILKKTERYYGTINVSDDPDCDVDFGVDDKGMLILGGDVTWLPLKELEKIKYRVIPEEDEGHPMDSYICFEFKNKARVYIGIGLDYWPGEKFEFVYNDTYWGIENAKEVITADYNWYQPAEFITKGNKLVGYMGKETNIVIPNGIKVIGNNAFQNYKGVMESVKLSDTVKEIKPFAFGNPKLKSIDLNNVEIIGDHAFRASQLKQITLPKSLKVLGEEVFYFSGIKSLKCIKNESKVEVTDKHLNGESLIDV